MNDSMTNVTFYMNQIERQAYENINDLSSQMNSTTKKIGLLWRQIGIEFTLLNSLAIFYPSFLIVTMAVYALTN